MYSNNIIRPKSDTILIHKYFCRNLFYTKYGVVFCCSKDAEQNSNFISCKILFYLKAGCLFINIVTPATWETSTNHIAIIL